MTTIRSTPVIIAALLLLAGCQSHTARPTTAPATRKASEKKILRIYDVHDLLVPVADFLPPGKEPATQPTPGESARDLVHLITESVAPSSWRKSSGEPAAIRAQSRCLVIIQTEKNHKAISKFLEELRDDRKLTVMVEMRLLCVPEAIATELMSGESSTRPTTAPATRPGIVDAARIGRWMRDVQQNQDATVLSAPRVTVYNGQRAFVTIASQKAYTADFKKLVKGDGTISHEPVIETVESGLTWELRATASRSRDTVRIWSHPKLASLLGFDTVKWPGADDEKLLIQQPRLAVWEINTELEVPNGETAVYGGIALPENFAEGDMALNGFKPKAGQMLIVLVTPRIISEESPATRPAKVNAPADSQ